MTPGENFSKQDHILKTGDFRRVYNRGSSSRKSGVALFCLINNLDRTRIGLSISSKYIKLATARNRAKRLLREVYRKNRKNLKAGFDMVVTIKKSPVKEFSYRDMEKLFMGLAENRGLIK